jgi:hypothetical protein
MGDDPEVGQALTDAQAALDKLATASALPAGMTQADVDQAKNAEEPDAVATTPAQAATAATPTAGADPVDAKLNRFKELLAKAGKPAAAPATASSGAPAAGAATKPAAGAKSDPAVLKIQQDLIAKGAKIKADGIMGPQTQAAMKQFGGAATKPAAPAAGTNSATTNADGMDFSQVGGA